MEKVRQSNGVKKITSIKPLFVAGVNNQYGRPDNHHYNRVERICMDALTLALSMFGLAIAIIVLAVILIMNTDA